MIEKYRTEFEGGRKTAIRIYSPSPPSACKITKKSLFLATFELWLVHIYKTIEQLKNINKLKEVKRAVLLPFIKFILQIFF